MGFSGGIQTLNSSDFRLDMGNFKEALHKQWPDIQIKDAGISKGDIDFGMTINGQFNSSVGSTIQQDQIGWWASLEEFAEFIVWFRRYVPNEYQLLAHSKNFYNYLLISSIMSETEVLRGLSGDRYAFELVSPTQDLNTRRIFEQTFNQSWPDSFFFEDGAKGVTWFLKSQQGYIESDDNSIHFSDNNLDFASQFAVWTGKTLNSNLKLIAKSDHMTTNEFEANITVQTSQQELLTRFIEEGFIRMKDETLLKNHR